MKEVPLRGGGVAVVDDEDHERVAHRLWRLDSEGYPIETGVRFRAGQKRIVTYLHHVILPKRSDCQVDHRDGDKRNAQRWNLRYATPSQNQANRHKIRTSTGIKGVTFHKGTGRYQAQVKKDGRNHYLGLHTDPVDAGRAYIKKSRELSGEFAWSNVREEDAA